MLPKLEYALPPSDKLNPVTMQKNELKNAINSVNLPVSDAVVRIIDGASNAYAQYLLTDKLDISDLYEKIKNSLNPPAEYYIFEKDGFYKDLYFADIYQNDSSIKKHKYSNIIDLCSDYYDYIIQSSKLNEKISNLKTLLNPLIKRRKEKLKKLSYDIAQCAEKEKYNLYGQLLLTYGYDIKTGAFEYDAIDIFSEDNNIIKIPLDVNLTSYENAEKYFKKYKKLKSAEEHIPTRLI